MNKEFIELYDYAVSANRIPKQIEFNEAGIRIYEYLVEVDRDAYERKFISWLRDVKNLKIDDNLSYINAVKSKTKFLEFLKYQDEIDKKNNSRLEAEIQSFKGDGIVNAFDYSDVNFNIFESKKDILKSIEDRLIKDGYFNSELKYMTKRGKKIKLVALIHILHKLKIIKPNVAIIKHRKFFEKRYKVEIDKQMQSNQFDIIKIKNYKADFFFISDLVDNYTSIF